MKIRILDQGFANMTGLLGTVEFVDGVSVDEVSKAEAARLGTILSIECVESGVNPSITQQMVDLHHKNTEEMGLVFANITQGSIAPEVAADQPEVVAQIEPLTPVRSTVLSYDYTEDQLDTLVKSQSIAGLRAFAEQYDVNDRSVAGLIQKLMALKAEKNPVAQVEPEAPVVEVVEPEPEVVEVADAEELEKALGDIEAQE